jgi:protein-L-isoaspartate(D-aspartate) O-methyltransferase
MEKSEPFTHRRKGLNSAGIGVGGVVLMLVMVFFFSWLWKNQPVDPDEGVDNPKPGQQEDELDRYQFIRRRMVETQMRDRDITDPRVLKVMEKVPRHLFVPNHEQATAYDDRPLPIGYGQTISQPYIVALMTQAAKPKAQSRALEVGAGCGYQSAVLAELCKEVYAIEILEPLATTTKKRLAVMGYTNITLRCGDGYQGWKEHAPFDVILVTAAPEHVPKPLIEQLAIGGRMVIPVGEYYQDLLLLEKKPDGSIRSQGIAPVAFVPMIGEAQDRKDE